MNYASVKLETNVKNHSSLFATNEETALATNAYAYMKKVTIMSRSASSVPLWCDKHMFAVTWACSLEKSEKLSRNYNPPTPHPHPHIRTIIIRILITSSQDSVLVMRGGG